MTVTDGRMQRVSQVFLICDLEKRELNLPDTKRGARWFLSETTDVVAGCRTEPIFDISTSSLTQFLIAVIFAPYLTPRCVRGESGSH